PRGSHVTPLTWADWPENARRAFWHSDRRLLRRTSFKSESFSATSTPATAGRLLILKLGDPDSCWPRHHRDSHRKNVRRSNGIWESCSDTGRTARERGSTVVQATTSPVA